MTRGGIRPANSGTDRDGELFDRKHAGQGLSIRSDLRDESSSDVPDRRHRFSRGKISIAQRELADDADRLLSRLPLQWQPAPEDCPGTKKESATRRNDEFPPVMWPRTAIPVNIEAERIASNTKSSFGCFRTSNGRMSIRPRTLDLIEGWTDLESEPD
jgi:hypothetical protein